MLSWVARRSFRGSEGAGAGKGARAGTPAAAFALLPYEQNTHIFEYYILRGVLFFSLNAFLEWCVSHNLRGELLFDKTSLLRERDFRHSAIFRFAQLLQTASRHPQFLECVRFVELKLDLLKAKTHRRTYRRRLAHFQRARTPRAAAANTARVDSLFLQTMRMTLHDSGLD